MGASAMPWDKYGQQPAAGPWAKYAAPTSPAAQQPDPEPGLLDREIPLDSYTHATESGLQSIGRGVRGALQGIGSTIMHPIETAKGIGALPGQAMQVPGAIHDINQSSDPLGTYAKVGQETAGQGAGQALTALATEGIAKSVPPILRAAKPIARTALRTASDAIDPDITGLASPRLAHAQRLAGRIADKLEPKSTYPGAHLPEAPPTYPGAPLPEHPGVFPGAPLPENPGTFPGAHLPDNPGEFPGAPLPAKPAPEILQARPLAEGGKPAPELPGGALGKIPVAKQPEIMQPAKSAPVDTSNLGTLLNEGTGGGIPNGFTPVKSSALLAYKYDPAAREFTSITPAGATYVHGDISPEQAQAFEQTASKGKAWSTLKNNGTYVGKMVNGQRVYAKPPKGISSASPDDLAPEWQKAVDAVKARKR